jgi:hypothetical protein
LKALIFSFFALVIVGILLEMSRGVLPSLGIVLDDAFGKLVNSLFDAIGI